MTANQERFFEMVCNPDTDPDAIFTYFRENRKEIDLETPYGEQRETLFHILAKNGDDSILDGLLRDLSSIEICKLLTAKDAHGNVPLSVGTKSTLDVMLYHLR